MVVTIHSAFTTQYSKLRKHLPLAASNLEWTNAVTMSS